MGKYRMDTPKGQVQFAYDQHGQAAALQKATALGVASKTKRWFEEWAKPSPSSPAPGTTRRRVRSVGFPKEHKGTVLREGPEVSEVQWDTGEVRYVPNDWLITQVPVKKKSKRGR